MDLRNPLFHLEQWSPGLARKIWGLTPLLHAPFTLVMGFKVKVLDDNAVEVEIPYSRQNRDEAGPLQASVLVAAAEFGSSLLWKRHVSPDLEEVRLHSLQCQFLKPAYTLARARASLNESDREKTLRKLRSGEEALHEISVVLTDARDQTLATVNGLWALRPLRPLALERGGSS